MGKPRTYRQLPAKLAEIHNRPGDPPLATIDECRSIRTYLESNRLLVSPSEIQAARRAGVKSEYRRSKEERQRLKWIAAYNEDLLAEGNRSENVRPSEPDGQAFLCPRDLARVFDVPYEALRKRLDRFRRKNMNGWNEVTEPRPREAHFTYRVAAVKPIIDVMKASGQMSSERPAKNPRPR